MHRNAEIAKIYVRYRDKTVVRISKLLLVVDDDDKCEYKTQSVIKNFLKLKPRPQKQYFYNYFNGSVFK